MDIRWYVQIIPSNAIEADCKYCVKRSHTIEVANNGLTVATMKLVTHFAHCAVSSTGGVSTL